MSDKHLVLGNIRKFSLKHILWIMIKLAFLGRLMDNGQLLSISRNPFREIW